MTQTDHTQLGVSANHPSWPDTDSGTPADRLRSRLRRDLARELPGRVEEVQQTNDEPVVPAARRELARQILDQAIRQHSEEELLANRTLLGPDSEQQVAVEVLREVFGMAGLQPLLDDPDIESLERTAPAAIRSARSSATTALSTAGVACQSVNVTTNTAEFAPGGTVGVTVSCVADFGDALLLGVPGSRTLTATAHEPIDTWRATGERT